jgi:hypothetical protein
MRPGELHELEGGTTLEIRVLHKRPAVLSEKVEDHEHDGISR